MGKTMSIDGRIAALRQLMSREHLGAFIFTSHVPRGYEEAGSSATGWHWLTGLGEGKGTAVVTQKSAAVWMEDGMSDSLWKPLEGSEVTLLSADDGAAPTVTSWTGQQLADGGLTEVGVDGDRTPYLYIQPLITLLRRAGGLTLRTNFDPMVWLWPDHPRVPKGDIKVNPSSDFKSSCHERLALVRRALRGLHADGMLAADPADIAWSLDLNDPSAPQGQIFDTRLLISTTDATLFVQADRVSAAVTDRLAADGVAVRDLGSLADGLRHYFEYNLLLDPSELSYNLFLLASVRPVVATPSPIPALRTNF